jgi:hypothetical protein
VILLELGRPHETENLADAGLQLACSTKCVALKLALLLKPSLCVFFFFSHLFHMADDGVARVVAALDALREAALESPAVLHRVDQLEGEAQICRYLLS